MTIAPDPPSPPRSGRGLEAAARVSGRLLVIAVAIAVLLWILARLKIIVVPVAVSVFLASLLTPPAQWLLRRGWPRAAATTAVTLGSVAVLGGVAFALGPSTASGATKLGGELDGAQARVQTFLQDNFGVGDQQLAHAVDLVQEQFRSGSALSGSVVSGAVLAGEFVAGLILTIVLTIYLVHDGAGLARWLGRFLPPSQQAWARRTGLTAWTVLGRYARGLALVGLVDALLLGLVLVVLGVPLVLTLMLITFIGAFLPIVGAFVSGLLAAAVALVDGGPAKALVVVAAAVVIQQLEGHVVAPQIYGRALALHPVIVIAAIAVGSITAGIIGAFLAVPVAAVLAGVLPTHEIGTPTGDP